MQHIRDDICSLHVDLNHMYKKLDREALLALYKKKMDRMNDIKDNTLVNYLEIGQIFIEGGTIFNLFMNKFGEDVTDLYKGISQKEYEED